MAPVQESSTERESITVRITTVSLREPRVGDKFASRHGRLLGRVVVDATERTQKGTVGQLMHTADLPFTQDGTVPDRAHTHQLCACHRHCVQFARHTLAPGWQGSLSFRSLRMTMGQLWETVLAKLNALAGINETYGVPFTPVDNLMQGCRVRVSSQAATVTRTQTSRVWLSRNGTRAVVLRSQRRTPRWDRIHRLHILPTVKVWCFL